MWVLISGDLLFLLFPSLSTYQRYFHSEKDAVHRSEVAVKGALTGKGSTSPRPMCHSFLYNCFLTSRILCSRIFAACNDFIFFSNGQAIFELGGGKGRKGKREEAEDVKILQG